MFFYLTKKRYFFYAYLKYYTIGTYYNILYCGYVYIVYTMLNIGPNRYDKSYLH